MLIRMTNGRDMLYFFFLKCHQIHKRARIGRVTNDREYIVCWFSRIHICTIW